MGLAYFPQIKFTFYVLAQKVGAIPNPCPASGRSIHDDSSREPFINFKHSRLPEIFGHTVFSFSQ